MNRQKFLLVIGGATATGKTALAVRLARHFGTEILSADSRQFYREMSIGTAKPTPTELAAAPHHFIDSLSVTQHYTVGDFERDALQLLDVLFQKMDVAILVGGSGLFIRAVCEGLDEFPDVPETVMLDLEKLLETAGIEALQSELKERDPAYFASVDLSNPHRLLRALSVCRASGMPFSAFRKNEKTTRPFMPVYVLLDGEREVLYEKINRRVDGMMANGLLEEARQLYPQRYLNSLQTVGYQELFDFVDGKCTRDEAVEKIKQHSRRYAKRQATWFRKDPHWKRFGPEDADLIVNYLEERLGGAGLENG